MTDLQATLDAIDTLAVHQCAWCSKPLAEDGPSADFCEDYCQAAWLANRHEVVELVGYREPYDLPEYQGNQVELRSPEVTPAVEWSACSCGACGGPWQTATFTLTYDDSRLREAIGSMWERLYSSYYERIVNLTSWQPSVQIQGISPLASWIMDEARWYSVGEPTSEQSAVTPDEPFDPDYEYDWRPVPGLHDPEPLLPVMPAVERDWQALANASRPPVSFAPPPQGAPRRNRRLR